MLRFQRVWGLACRACVPLLRMWVVLAIGTLGLFEVERIHGGACCYLFMDCRTSAFSPSNYRIGWTLLFSVYLKLTHLISRRAFYLIRLYSPAPIPLRGVHEMYSVIFTLASVMRNTASPVRLVIKPPFAGVSGPSRWQIFPSGNGLGS